MKRCCLLLLLSLSLFVTLSTGCSHPPDPHTGWPTYGGGKDNIHYSSLTNIDTNNVSQLQPAWIYHTGDADTAHHSQMQCNPIVVNGILYGISPTLKLFAIEAATGRHRWTFDPMVAVNWALLREIVTWRLHCLKRIK